MFDQEELASTRSEEEEEEEEDNEVEPIISTSRYQSDGVCPWTRALIITINVGCTFYFGCCVICANQFPAGEYLTILCFVCLFLVCLWFGKYDAGYSWATNDPAVFSWHPTLMTAGLLVCFSQAVIAYRTYSCLKRPTRKIVHGLLHSCALLCIVIGLRAVFRFHNEKLPTPIPNLYSFHSWLGILTSVVFFAQYLFGFFAFGYPKLSASARASTVTPHTRSGILILVCLVACTVCTGVLEKMTFGGDCNINGVSNTKCHVANSFGLVVVALVICVATLLLLPKQ